MCAEVAVCRRNPPTTLLPQEECFILPLETGERADGAFALLERGDEDPIAGQSLVGAYVLRSQQDQSSDLSCNSLAIVCSMLHAAHGKACNSEALCVWAQLAEPEVEPYHPVSSDLDMDGFLDKANDRPHSLRGTSRPGGGGGGGVGEDGSDGFLINSLHGRLCRCGWNACPDSQRLTTHILLKA